MRNFPLDITDDNGEVLTITNKNYHITLSKNGKEVNSFSYKGTRIIIKDNEVFYAGTKVEYFDQSFHSFNVTENISIECISQGKFEIRKNGKKIAKAKVKDINGAEYELEAVEKGMEITNSNNELMESIVVGTNYISVSGDKVIINGKTMEAHIRRISYLPRPPQQLLVRPPKRPPRKQLRNYHNGEKGDRTSDHDHND